MNTRLAATIPPITAVPGLLCTGNGETHWNEESLSPEHGALRSAMPVRERTTAAVNALHQLLTGTKHRASHLEKLDARE